MHVGVLSYPMLFQTEGGLQTQIRETNAALVELGVDVALVEPTRESLAKYDVVHVYGTNCWNHRILETARALDRPTVLSVLCGPWSAANVAISRIAERVLGRLTGWTVATTFSQVTKALVAADRVIALSKAEAGVLVDRFGVPAGRSTVIPNGVSGRFFDAAADAFCRHAGLQPGFVLCVASISQNKNQLTLARALDGTGLPIVLVGPCAPDMRDYLSSVLRFRDVRYVGPIAHDDPLLGSAYAAAGVSVLPSKEEIWPLTPLESLASGTPTVVTTNTLMDLAPAPGGVTLVAPFDREGLRRAVIETLRSPRAKAECQAIARSYTWIEVGRKVRLVYEEVRQDHQARRRSFARASNVDSAPA